MSVDQQLISAFPENLHCVCVTGVDRSWLLASVSDYQGDGVRGRLLTSHLSSVYVCEVLVSPCCLVYIV